MVTTGQFETAMNMCFKNVFCYLCFGIWGELNFFVIIRFLAGKLWTPKYTVIKKHYFVLDFLVSGETGSMLFVIRSRRYIVWSGFYVWPALWWTGSYFVYDALARVRTGLRLGHWLGARITSFLFISTSRNIICFFSCCELTMIGAKIQLICYSLMVNFQRWTRKLCSFIMSISGACCIVLQHSTSRASELRS